MRSITLSVLKTTMILLSLLIMVSFIESEKLNERPFEIFKNSKLLKKNKITSLTVFANVEIDLADGHGGYLGKIEEMEFDKNGNQIYRLTTYGTGYTPFINYARGSKIETDKYDQHNRLVRTYYEDFKTTIEIILRLDKQGNLINYEYSHNGQPLKKIELNAENEQLIDTKTKYKRIPQQYRKIITTQREKTKTMPLRHYKSEFRYEYFGDSLRTTFTYYAMDTLVMSEFYTTLSKIDQITYYRKTDHLGRTEQEIKAKFDEFGNLIYYSRFGYDHDKPYVEYESNVTAQIIKIKNEYDHRGFLVKRYFYKVDQNYSIDKLETVETYRYDTDTLSFKFKEGILYNFYQKQYDDEIDN